MIKWLVQEIYQETGESWVEVVMDDFNSEDAANQFVYDFRRDHQNIDEFNLKVVSYKVVSE